MPPATASNVIYITVNEAVATNFVYIIEPTTASRVIYVIPVSDIARDVGNITIQSITQTYFQENIKKFLPSEFWALDAESIEEGGGAGALGVMTQVFAVTLDEIKQAIDEFPQLFDIDHCPPKYLRVIAELLNFPLEDVDTVAEQRRQLKLAINLYKTKGARKAFTAILYAFGFYSSIIPLWTEDYEVFYETIPGVAKGNDPPNNYKLLVENGGTWYRSPHFGIRLEGIIGDRHVWIDWGSVSSTLKDEYDALAEQYTKHKAFYLMKDELIEAGATLQYHFDEDEFNYMWRRLEFLRPVFAVLDWLELQFFMQENYVVPDGDFVMTANPYKSEKGWYLGYCDLDDIIYTRLDERLLGTDYLSITSPLTGASPGVTSVVNEEVYVISGTETTLQGVLTHNWLYTGVTFTVTVGASDIDLEDNGEGVLGEGRTDINGFIDYLTGEWVIYFWVGNPDDGSSVYADYNYTTEVPPTDRSGALPRGSTELPFPHLRDPQEGYCHPPEDLYIDWYYTEEDEYQLSLTRDGLGLYPKIGPTPKIDHSDFPSRGFTDGSSQPGHANTFTREKGYSTRPLSRLIVEANPDDESGNWENLNENWEDITEDWDV